MLITHEDVNCIKIPEGATNGDVINSVFPDLAEYLFLNVFEEEWRNGPYRKEGEKHV